MVALELARRRVKESHQVKILKYTVDFVLPDEKVVLEIDVKLFHGKDKHEYQQRRDKAILKDLGSDWDVIRISTDHINKNVAQLMTAIKTIKRKRKFLKEDYGGKIPKWYSETAV
ncbi:MAG: DUF559 domain-containing protein [Oscillospiraceae bacterium]|jgi:very-short-patch-repair endonuclease|nr:DUF559 domain-containing protein [Oscillospiraceae bacterium]